MEPSELDSVLDKILLTALFNTLSTEQKKAFLSSAYQLIDQSFEVDTSSLNYLQTVQLHDSLLERLYSRFPESRVWPRSLLLENY